MSVLVRRGELLRPAAGDDPAPFDANRLDRVDPGDLSGTVNRDQHQQAAIEGVTARTEVLETVDWRQAGIGVVEGEQLPVHGAPGALCGHVGEQVSGPVSPDVLHRELEEREPRPLVEAAANLGLPDLLSAGSRRFFFQQIQDEQHMLGP